ncbi:adenylate cyclase [Maribacter dokdonensis]|uniref:Adenylate cyclase n=2 Tax=Maribacter dokdonensis TaxID=320912 RepID=A0ABY0UMP4_9FLAO|nr:adenylate cyclase [Maribacter dokdonensis]
MIYTRYMKYLFLTVTVWLSFFITFQISLSYILNDFQNPVDSLLFLIIVSFPVALISGIVTETMDYVMFDYNLLRDSYFLKIFLKSILHVIVFIIVIYEVAFFFSNQAEELGIKTTNAFKFVTTENGFLLLLLYSYLISFLVNFLRQINQHLGHKTLLNFLIGKYRKPQEDNRIFLFLDLDNSTTLAEQMGHYNYSSLVQDCFKDLTQVIYRYDAEVYQYVGDQVVLHWENTARNKSYLVELFFNYESVLLKRKEYYQKKYNVLPSFKAGADVGPVMVSEVGEIKKMIAYHGDVLNVAARIEGLCKILEKKFLVSQHFFESEFSTPINIDIEYVDTRILKGKTKKIHIYNISKQNNQTIFI